MIECKELCASYGEKQVLDRISFSLSPQEVVAVVGKNASGKTTLLRSLIGTLQSVTGEVLFDGVPRKNIKRKDIARKMAYLPQHTQPSSLSVFDTVLMGRFPHLSYPRIYRRCDEEIARACIEELGLSPFIDTPVTELSGGFRQRCALASALATESQYLLLDEPTAFLDIESSLDLLRTLRSLAQRGKGVLVVLHDLPLALRFADRVLVLDGSRLVADDTPNALFHSGMLEKIFGIQLRYCDNDGEKVYFII